METLGKTALIAVSATTLGYGLGLWAWLAWRVLA